MSTVATFAGKLKTQLYWWLSTRRGFVINDEYRIELLHIDKNNSSAKILVTNLKSNEQIEGKVEHD